MDAEICSVFILEVNSDNSIPGFDAVLWYVCGCVTVSSESRVGVCFVDEFVCFPDLKYN